MRRRQFIAGLGAAILASARPWENIQWSLGRCRGFWSHALWFAGSVAKAGRLLCDFPTADDVFRSPRVQLHLPPSRLCPTWP
jgi:hypothetical protein